VYVVIVGAGEVGRHVVRALEKDKHDVVVVDKSRAALDQVEEHHDVMTLLGYGAAGDVLEKARAGTADMVVAVTDHDEVNLIAALAAKQMGAKRVVARVQGSEWSGNHRDQGVSYNLLGVDVVFNPRVLLAQEIVRIAQSHGALEVVDLANHAIEVVQMELPETSRQTGKRLAKLHLPRGVLVGAVVRDGQLFIPGGADALQPQDRVYLIGSPEKMVEAEDLFSTQREAKRVCILGGGVVGESLARGLVATGAEVLLIERIWERAQRLAADLSRVTVVHGDGTDIRLLDEERVGNYDLFVALSHEDEVNLMAGLLAKRAGAKRAAALVHRPDYVEIYRELGIDVVLSPRTVASDHILRYCRRAELQSLTVLEDGQAEILEVVAHPKSRVVDTPLRRLTLPRGSLLCAVIKPSGLVIPGGDDVVEAWDTVIVLATQAARSSVGKMFTQRAL
jgi:trk system potassium uptake protein